MLFGSETGWLHVSETEIVKYNAGNNIKINKATGNDAEDFSMLLTRSYLLTKDESEGEEVW